MGFSWKISKKDAISKLKLRVHVFEKTGEMKKAEKVKNRLKTMQE